MAPTISAVSGTVATGNSLTVTCTGAGTKVRSKPFMFADWQEGSLNPHSTLSNTTSFTSTQNRVIVSDGTNKRWGSGYVVKASWPRDGTGAGSSSVLEVDVTTMAAGSKMFVYGWRKWTSGDSTGNWKWWRFWPSGGAGNYPDAYIGDSDISDTGNRGWFLENGTPVTGSNRTYFGYPTPTSTWQLDEILVKLNSTPGAIDGTLIVYVDNDEQVNDTTFAFDFSGIVGPIRKVDFQDTKASSLPGASMNAWVDTFYIDDSWSRVYIGDASTYAACTVKEIQPFTSWSNTSITLNCRMGTFASATGKYLYLVDGNNVASSGFALTGAAGAPAPSIISLSPSSGPAAGGTTVTATCTSLVATPSVTVGGGNATGEAFVSSSSMTFVTPSGTAGARNVVVTNPDAQTGTLTGGFTYVAAPTIVSVSPSTGGISGGTTITLVCTDLSSTLTGIKLGTIPCTSVTRVSSTSATCVVPSIAAGTYDLTVMNSDGQTGTLTNGFTVAAPPIAPSITNCFPSSGPQSGGNTIAINGTDFTIGTTTVSVDGLPGTSVNVISDTILTVVMPAHMAGFANIAVTNSYGLTGTLLNGYEYSSSQVVGGRRRALATGRSLV